ncbi:MAG: DUF4037 domain-containing protein [Oscillospiraceae bacterium]|jgi:hypothetical protein|nr:DUF4037 domain-containing protein [Oscillospiraceae bacterium]
MKDFIKGMDLCHDFFTDYGRPVLTRKFPGLLYSAGLLGFGSDVLGYDDAVSTDHMWGPRFYLFLRETDLAEKKDAIMAAFSHAFPYMYKGYAVHFSPPDPNDGGVRHAVEIRSGPVSPLVYIQSVDAFLSEYLGTHDLTHLTPADWLAFSEHRLLALRAGRLFYDALGLANSIAPLRFYPDDVRLYLIASQWSLIAEEQAFVKRCGMVGDDMGSRIVATRIAERLMRLCFLYKGQYAPYSKWFGTAFSALPVQAKIKDAIKALLSTDDLPTREDAAAHAQLYIAELHNESGVNPRISASITTYFGRDIKVIWANRIADTLKTALKGGFFEDLPLIGSVSQIGSFTALSDNPHEQMRIKEFYS